MIVAIVDYGSGNLRSAAKAFERAAHEAGIAADIVVTGNPDQVARADRIVLPGVGAFADCRAGLMAIDGMWQALEEAVSVRQRPFLGICVGMQLMAERGLEHGEWSGFGWIGGDVIRLSPDDPKLKIPHMGWNTIEVVRPHALVSGLTSEAEPHVYFVHSYSLVATDPSDVVARTDYGGPVTAIVARDNMAGTQFHPEKSQRVGLTLIANFLRWNL